MMMPEFYHGRLRTNTDKQWIMSRMRWIPLDKQKAVADKYSHIFLSEKSFGRKKANEYLQQEAKMYREEAAANGK